MMQVKAMDITPPGDDKGVRRLKLENRKRGVEPARNIAPYPRIASSDEHNEPRPPLLPERRQQQRRKQERRHSPLHTPYDTRSGEDRRTEKRRMADHYLELKEESDASSSAESPQEHIDEEV
ncbi:MAG: hypothetical protein ACQETD_10265 [Pseudomonadota bacterium]